MAPLSTFLVVLFLTFHSGQSFLTTNPYRSPICVSCRISSEENNIVNVNDHARRGAVAFIAGQLTIAIVQDSHAVVMENTQTVFQAGQALTMDEAEERLKKGRKDIQYLLDHYDEVCQGGGDNVRRYLGTVGITSGLFGISKVMNTLSERADDFVEFTELANEVNKSIQQADGSAYMAIFVTTSTSQTPPSKYFADAKIEIKRCIKALDELAALVDVKF